MIDTTVIQIYAQKCTSNNKISLLTNIGILREFQVWAVRLGDVELVGETLRIVQLPRADGNNLEYVK